jgi:hypothetical protein
VYICTPQGPVAERLGRALQKLVQRFESARDLLTKPPSGGFFMPLFFEVVGTFEWIIRRIEFWNSRSDQCFCEPTLALP